MSFQPIKFTFTPPPTIPTQAIITPSSNSVGVVQPVSNQFGTGIAAASKAAALVTRLSDLSDTTVYLQQALTSLVKNLGVTFDLSANPDLGRALARIYNVSAPPPSMDMQMYTTLLQTDINFLKFDLLNPPDSPVQIQPTQRADISLAAKMFENSLINSGVYNQTLPILLRSLAGDQVIFDSWKNSLMQYPILSVSQLTPAQLASTAKPTSSSSRDLNGASIDVSSSLSSTMNNMLDQWQNSYAGIYTTIASPDPTELALPSIVTTLSTQPTSDLNRLLVMLNNLIAFQHQPALRQSHDSADSLIMPRLMSDVGGHVGNLDYVSQVAVGPSNNFGSSMGTLMTTLSAINPGIILGVGLTGTVARSAGGYNRPPLTPAQTASLSGIPEGLQILGANVAWSQAESNRQNALVQKSVQRLGFRRLSNQGNQTELLVSMKSISSSAAIISSILQSNANTPTPVGNTTSLNRNAVSPNAGLTSFGTLVNSLQSQSGSSFALDGNSLVVTPPQIPTAPTNVQSILAKGGVNQITTQSLKVPINLNV